MTNNIPEFIESKSSVNRGVSLIFISLVFVFIPKYFYFIVFDKKAPSLLVYILFSIAVIVFFVAIFKICKNEKYVFSINNGCLRQQYSGNDSYNFQVRLEDVVSVEVVGPEINPDHASYYINTKSGDKFQIVMINGSSPRKISRAINECLSSHD